MDNAHHPLTHFFERLDAQSHSFQQLLPPTSMVQQFAQEIFDFLFPIHCEQPRRASVKYAILGDELTRLLEPLDVEAAPTADAFFHNLPALHEKLLADAEATMAFDPAATSLQEVIITYPGFYAITIYRIAHELVKLGVPLLPRMLTEYAHGKTGIDIHPAAQIGNSFFIDHGTGLVIGATSILGNNVKLYQGVTLGALQVDKSLANTKRHPTIEDDVIIYANATILGGDTVVGHHSILGGNVWITRSVPPYSRVYHESKVSVRNKHDSEVINFVI
ncbi:MAG: serine acetyltransferase [Caldilineaceae bacterium]|nr:serine acetyltransferase [Caldilineaceae bacterium]MCB0139916.1 serine acetyltransferase [Caldilineaceae bacterium]MCB9156486.1 serine acetyltransferase [Caldilineaceae bacterium]